MSDHEHAARAAAWLRAERETIGPRPASAREPDPMIAAIADAIRAQGRRRTRTVLAAGALGLLAGGMGLWLAYARTPAAPAIAERPTVGATPGAPATPVGPTIEAGAFTLSDAGGAQLDTGGRAAIAGGLVTSGHTLSSRGEPTTLTGADGTVVRLEPRTDVALVRADAVRWFQLQRGTLEAHVAKLGPGRRFVVATADRQVEVRGTRFRVSLGAPDPACGGGTVTRVVVDEGVVTVRGPDGTEDRVAAGERWPANCAGATHATAERAHRPRPAEHASADPAPATPTPASPSTLAAENDLFGRAARAQRAGDAASALRLLDDLLAHYPGSPLRSAAEAERARLLERAVK